LIGDKAELGDVEEDVLICDDVVDDIVVLEDEDVVESTERSVTATTSTAIRVLPTPIKRRSYNSRSGPDENVVDVLTTLLTQQQAQRDADSKSRVEDRKSQETQRDKDRKLQEIQRDADRNERREDKKDEEDARRQDKKDEQDARRKDKKDMMLLMTQGKK